jgi:hypothetical protein
MYLPDLPSPHLSPKIPVQNILMSIINHTKIRDSLGLEYHFARPTRKIVIMANLSETKSEVNSSLSSN